MQYEMAGGLENGINPVPPDSLASLNTHDMPPFSAYWQGDDITQRQSLGLLGTEAALEESEERAAIKKELVRILEREGWLSRGEIEDIITACYALLADSRAMMTLVNLEDLWQETQPQNVPSTSYELPNWQRRAKLRLEQFSLYAGVIEALAKVNDIRNSEDG
jgi:4-alpha-glucanotransferase